MALTLASGAKVGIRYRIAWMQTGYVGMARVRAPARRRSAPPRHPSPLPLRRFACSGQSGMRGTFRPLRSSFRRSPLAPWRSPLARARPRSGLRRAFAPSVPAVALWLRLSGRAAPAPPGRSCPPPPSLRLGCGLGGSGPLASPGVPPVALGLLRALPCAPLRAPSAPGGCSLRRGPPPASGLRPAALRLPSGAPARGPWAAVAAWVGSGPRAWGLGSAACGRREKRYVVVLLSQHRHIWD